MVEYLIRGETLQNIADAIREKTGDVETIAPEEMAGKIRDVHTSDEGMPEDIRNEADRVVSGMQAKMAENSLNFIAMGDMHQFGDGEYSDATIVELYRKSNRDAGWGAMRIAEQMQLDFAINLGDLPFGTSGTTIFQGVDGILKAKQDTDGLATLLEYIQVPGNHDPLTFSYNQNGECLSPDVLSGLIGDYCFRDLEEKKIRLICLNTADNREREPHGGDSERISGQQLQWFAGTLDLSEKEDAQNWKILIFAHHPLDWGNVRPAGNCLAAYLAGEAFTCTHEGVEVSRDFSGKNAAEVIAQFHGHTHCFKVDWIHDNRSGSPVPTSVKRIAVPNTCRHRNNELGLTEKFGLIYGEETTYGKTSDNTGKSTSFCLVSVDLDGKVIYADCFGAGYDRVIPFGGAVNG